MRILLSNDDGYRAPGLACMARALTELGEVSVVAPDRDRSGASNSLTLDAPLRAQRAEQTVFLSSLCASVVRPSSRRTLGERT